MHNVTVPDVGNWEKDHTQGIVRVPEWLQSYKGSTSGYTNFIVTRSEEHDYWGGELYRFNHVSLGPAESDGLPFNATDSTSDVEISNSIPSYWMDHPGGMQMSGRYLFLGVEEVGGANDAEYAVFDLQNNTSAAPTQKWRYLDTAANGGAAGLSITHLQGENYTYDYMFGTLARSFLMAGTDGTNFRFFRLAPDAYKWVDVGSQDTACSPNYWSYCSPSGFSFLGEWGATGGSYGELQHISLVTQKDGKVFLIGTAEVSGADKIYVFRIYFNGQWMQSGQYCSQVLCPYKQLEKQVSTQGCTNDSMFEWSAGTYIMPPNRFAVYGTEGGSTDDLLDICEWDSWTP